MKISYENKGGKFCPPYPCRSARPEQRRAEPETWNSCSTADSPLAHWTEPTWRYRWIFSVCRNRYLIIVNFSRWSTVSIIASLWRYRRLSFLWSVSVNANYRYTSTIVEVSIFMNVWRYRWLPSYEGTSEWQLQCSTGSRDTGSTIANLWRYRRLPITSVGIVGCHIDLMEVAITAVL